MHRNQADTLPESFSLAAYAIYINILKYLFSVQKYIYLQVRPCITSL